MEKQNALYLFTLLSIAMFGIGSVHADGFTTGGGGGGGGSSFGSQSKGTTATNDSSSDTSSSSDSSSSSSSSDSSSSSSSSDSSSSSSSSDSSSSSSSSDSSSSSSSSDSSSSDSSSSDSSSSDSSSSDSITKTITGSSLSPLSSNSVSSIEIDGDVKTLTINGTNFGDGPNIILYDTFDHGVSGDKTALVNANNGACNSGIDGVLGLDTESQKGPQIGCWTDFVTYKPIYSDDARSGASSIQVYNGDTGRPLMLSKAFGEGVTELFISFWTKIPTGTFYPGLYWNVGGVKTKGIEHAQLETFPADSTWKMSWIFLETKEENSKFSQGNSPNICLPTSIGNGNFSLAGNSVGVFDIPDKADEFWSWGNWNRFSTWLRADPDNLTEDGHNNKNIFDVISKKGHYSVTADAAIFEAGNNDGYAKEYRHLNFPGYIKPYVSSNTRPLYDDFYLAIGPNSATRVELCNTPAYKDCSIISIQRPVSWTDNEIKILINNIGFDFTESDIKGGSIDAYLYFTDSNGVVNADGVKLN